MPQQKSSNWAHGWEIFRPGASLIWARLASAWCKSRHPQNMWLDFPGPHAAGIRKMEAQDKEKMCVCVYM